MTTAWPVGLSFASLQTIFIRVISKLRPAGNTAGMSANVWFFAFIVVDAIIREGKKIGHPVFLFRVGYLLPAGVEMESE